MESEKFLPIIIGETRLKQIVYQDINVRNQHICALGASGSGKSTAAMGIVLQKYFMGETVIVFNWRRCLASENILPEFRSDYIENRAHIDVAKDKLRLPLCSGFQNASGEKEDIRSIKRRLVSALKTIEGLTDAQGSLLEEAVDAVYNNGKLEKWGLAAVMWYLESLDTAAASRVASRLSVLGDENFILNGEFLPSGKIYEIDLLGLQYDEQAVVVEFLLNFLLRCAYQGAFVKNSLTIFIDECQNLNFKPESTMNILLNESRKLGISLVLAAPKIPSGVRGMSVVEQCGTRLYFTQEARETEKLARIISPAKPREYCSLLSNLRVGEYLACGEFQVGGEHRTIVKKLGVYVSQKNECFGRDSFLRRFIS